MPETRTWEGNAALRAYLVPIGELEPHPRNPRLGNVYEIGQSLDRFGQQRPILATRDGVIVAGHHVRQAALQRGWTHIAAVRSDLTDEEVEGYLLADNGTADQGYYDEAELASLLQQWEGDELAGTGFAPEDAQAVIRAMTWMPGDGLERAPAAPAPREQPLAQGTATAFNIVLTYDEPTYKRISEQLDKLMPVAGDTTYAETIRRIILGA